PNALRGTVAERQWRGDAHRLHVRVGDHLLLVDVPGSAEPAGVGEDVTVGFAPDDAVLLARGGAT
ncbi:TOBE domain-containing protein, partial [Streptomyces sp. SID11385]|uniref:TOBE domain-containing protein n=1 Tax=Streptomyces sp. SID11385 TaxID=2706031 RepID=UPI0013C6F996